MNTPHPQFILSEEFDETERFPLTQENQAARTLADDEWLMRERAQHDALALSLEEELDALWETMRTGEPSSVAEAVQPDPPGWPDL